MTAVGSRTNVEKVKVYIFSSAIAQRLYNRKGEGTMILYHKSKRVTNVRSLEAKESGKTGFFLWELCAVVIFIFHVVG